MSNIRYKLDYHKDKVEERNNTGLIKSDMVLLVNDKQYPVFEYEVFLNLDKKIFEVTIYGNLFVSIMLSDMEFDILYRGYNILQKHRTEITEHTDERIKINIYLDNKSRSPLFDTIDSVNKYFIK
jgi:hypothetical protein